MNRWTLVTGLLVPGLILMSGCHWTAPRYCPSDHYHSWDPVLGSCDACGACGGGCEGHTPSSYTKHMLTCAAGCGEIYWGEWISDPPDPCDPCDDCGNWIGPQPCGPSLVARLAAGWRSLWGYFFYIDIIILASIMINEYGMEGNVKNDKMLDTISA